jgi:hypothetical protein
VALVGVGVLLFNTSALAAGVVLALGVLYLLICSAAGAALNGIFLSALYQYAAHGEAPSGFDRDTLEHAFAPKKKR